MKPRHHQRSPLIGPLCVLTAAMALAGVGFAVLIPNAQAGTGSSAPQSALSAASAQPRLRSAQEDTAAQNQANGPAFADFVDITKVRPNVQEPSPGPNASTGTFQSSCGVNADRHLNPDNVIVAPGVSNGAHHMHDYVGNLTVDAFSTNASLAASDTTCTNSDQSTYYWPVLRLRSSSSEVDLDAPGGGLDNNDGTILHPASVDIVMKGNPLSKVTAMPRFLRIITGDAKAFSKGPANANASWSCTGFEDRQLKYKYPLCPAGSNVVRTFAFQSCWDGRNIDSQDHRTHVAFASPEGQCPAGFAPIPQLVERITYDVGADNQQIAVDSFPEEDHKAVTDHGDFVNVMTAELMNKAVDCINNGSKCG